MARPLNSETIAGYQPGGSYYASILDRYGATAADRVAAAAATGNGDTLTETFADVRSSAGITFPDRDDTSTFGNFWEQMTTDPLAAPIESTERVLANTLKSLFKNPLVLLALGVAVFYLLGGFDWAKRKIASA